MRENLRLYSGLVLAFFLLTHFLNNALGIISLDAMNQGFKVVMSPWNNTPGVLILTLALIVHIINALYSVYRRSTFRIGTWETLQISLGLMIPLLLSGHVATVFYGQLMYGFDYTYEGVIAQYWLVMPVWGVTQTIGMLVAWAHGCIGIHYWLRMRIGYQRFLPVLMTIAMVVPTLGLSGYIAAGFKAVQAAREDPAWLDRVLGSQKMTEEIAQRMDFWMMAAPGIAAAILIVPFILRMIRIELWRLQNIAQLTLPNGKSMRIERGATVLETLRENGVPHAAICGGRGRCTTCRVRVVSGLTDLPEPGPLEERALLRLGAPDAVRLACQIRPTTDISVTPLVAARIPANMSYAATGIDGQEQAVTIVHVALHGTEKLSETELPYDVLFVMNQFFSEMAQALRTTQGQQSNFNGDGLLAVYGLDSFSPAEGVRHALKGAKEMLGRVARLNALLADDLPFQIEIGIGIHHGSTIIGTMGPPDNQVLTVMGDSVNLAYGLEALSRQYSKPIIVSRETLTVGGIVLKDERLHSATRRSRAGELQFYALDATQV